MPTAELLPSTTEAPMLRLSDFYHLPQLATAVGQLAASGPGLIVVSGLDPRPAVAPALRDQLLPSGRTTIFRILIGEILAQSPEVRAVVVAEDPAVLRVPRAMRRRISVLDVRPKQSIAALIEQAAATRPDLLVLGRLQPSTAAAAALAARQGGRVIAQLDGVFRGPTLARHVVELGVPPDQVDCLTWSVFVQRLPTLCPECRRPAHATPAQLARLYAEDEEPPPHFYDAPGCPSCKGTGRQGDVAVFDIYRFPDDGCDPDAHPSLLPLERYARDLAAEGALALADVLQLEANQLHRTYQLLTASERALADANRTLERRLAELRAANTVLEQRTAAQVALQDIGQALISSTDLGDLVARVCRHANELCGADRAILYLFRDDSTAEVLAVNGWSPSLVHRQLPRAELDGGRDPEPRPLRGYPPGVPERHPDVEGVDLRAGLQVPLIAEGQPVGQMIVHSTRKNRFEAGQVALLRTFANQAALSIQRAALIAELREKIGELEAAQAALVERERLEREMELAREVQQSVLPRVFPAVSGYTFAAQNVPARQVGGDFYDVFTLDEGRLGLVIADVSGKGMPAALYMALTRSLLLAEARREPSPRSALLNVNRLLRELGDPHMFVTVFYGALDLQRRTLTYARAGHDYPLLFRGGAARPLGGSGTVLGAFDDSELWLTEERLDLASGDRLVLYTDGLPDALDATQQRLGLERLTAMFAARITLAPDECCAAILADLAAYQGSAPQFDDITLLIVAVDGAV